MGKQKKIRLDIVRVEPSKATQHGYVLILAEDSLKKSQKRILRIVIGPFEAQAIVIALENLRTSRPLTHELFKIFANTLNVSVKEVIINKFQEGVFFASIVIFDGNKYFEIDSRTSDAVALALRFACPVYTYDEILKAAGEPEDLFDFEINPIMKSEVKMTQTNNPEFDALAIEELQSLLDEAVDNENYELASKLRDVINKKNKK